ncbi:MAG: hypothetical protein EBY30_16500 [Rhodospirillales bacterium]|nr:hypothetical protein [Rhodospirillales bacterium]
MRDLPYGVALNQIRDDVSGIAPSFARTGPAGRHVQQEAHGLLAVARLEADGKGVPGAGVRVDDARPGKAIIRRSCVIDRALENGDGESDFCTGGTSRQHSAMLQDGRFGSVVDD